MTDAEKKFIEDRMPRFATLADVKAFIFKPDWSLAVPRYIQKGNAIITNPDWITAPYVQTLIWGPSTPV